MLEMAEIDLSARRRIAIVGPSCSGKTTLARDISNKFNLPHNSLDVMFHLPQWKPRPHEEFLALHNDAIAKDEWVIEGMYSKTAPQRLARADLIIFIDPAILGCGWRFFKRSMADFGRVREGAPEGCKEQFSPYMYYYTLWDYPMKRRKKYYNMVELHSDKTLILKSWKALLAFRNEHEIS